MGFASSVVPARGRPSSSASISSVSQLGDFVRDGAAISTAMSVKVGTRRGGKKLKASKRGLMGTKVSLLAGGTNKQLLPSRCVLSFLTSIRFCSRLTFVVSFVLLPCRVVSPSFSATPLFTNPVPGLLAGSARAFEGALGIFDLPLPLPPMEVLTESCEPEPA